MWNQIWVSERTNRFKELDTGGEEQGKQNSWNLICIIFMYDFKQNTILTKVCVCVGSEFLYVYFHETVDVMLIPSYSGWGVIIRLSRSMDITIKECAYCLLTESVVLIVLLQCSIALIHSSAIICDTLHCSIGWITLLISQRGDNDGRCGDTRITQTIINAVQKGIFVFKSLSIKADRGHIAHFLLGRLLRGCPSLEYITNDEKIYGNLTFW